MAKDKVEEDEGRRVTVDRRKLLSAVGSTAGVSALAAGGAAAEEDRELTEETLARALAEMEYVPVPDDHPDASKRGVTPDPSAMVEGAEVYTGKYRNADTPSGKPYEIQSFDEWRRQDAPTGFDRDQIEKNGSEFLYLKEVKEDVDVGGYTIDQLGVGVGVQIAGSGLTNVEASLSFDIYINKYSVAITSFSIAYGPEKGVCVSPPLPTFLKVIPGLEIDLCIDAKLLSEGSQLCPEFGLSLSACVNPCGDTVDCGYCKGIGSPPLKGCIDKPW